MTDQEELDPERAEEELEEAQEEADTSEERTPDDPTEPPEEENEKLRKEKGGAGQGRKTGTDRPPEKQRGEPDPKERSSTT